MSGGWTDASRRTDGHATRWGCALLLLPLLTLCRLLTHHLPTTAHHLQNLFAIVQGGLDLSPGGLREQCVAAMVARDLPGYAIGGLAGGEDKDTFWRVVAHGTARLPRGKVRPLRRTAPRRAAPRRAARPSLH